MSDVSKTEYLFTRFFVFQQQRASGAVRPIPSRRWCASLRETIVWSVTGTGAILVLEFARGALGGVAPVGVCWHPAGWWLVPFLGYAAVNVAVVSRVGWLGWWDWLGSTGGNVLARA